MAGVAGKSGRWSGGATQQRQRTIQRAWDIAEQVMNGKGKFTKEQFELVKIIVQKSIPEQQEHTGTLKLVYGDATGKEIGNPLRD